MACISVVIRTVSPVVRLQSRVVMAHRAEIPSVSSSQINAKTPGGRKFTTGDSTHGAGPLVGLIGIFGAKDQTKAAAEPPSGIVATILCKIHFNQIADRLSLLALKCAQDEANFKKKLIDLNAQAEKCIRDGDLENYQSINIEIIRRAVPETQSDQFILPLLYRIGSTISNLPFMDGRSFVRGYVFVADNFTAGLTWIADFLQASKCAVYGEQVPPTTANQAIKPSIFTKRILSTSFGLPEKTLDKASRVFNVIDRPSSDDRGRSWIISSLISWLLLTLISFMSAVLTPFKWALGIICWIFFFP